MAKAKNKLDPTVESLLVGKHVTRRWEVRHPEAAEWFATQYRLLREQGKVLSRANWRKAIRQALGVNVAEATIGEMIERLKLDE